MTPQQPHSTAADRARPAKLPLLTTEPNLALASTSGRNAELTLPMLPEIVVEHPSACTKTSASLLDHCRNRSSRFVRCMRQTMSQRLSSIQGVSSMDVLAHRPLPFSAVAATTAATNSNRMCCVSARLRIHLRMLSLRHCRTTEAAETPVRLIRPKTVSCKEEVAAVCETARRQHFEANHLTEL